MDSATNPYNPVRQQKITRPVGCGCPPWYLVDRSGNVLELQTCPVCVNKALDGLRGICYNGVVVKGRETYEYQRDLFVEPSGSAITPKMELEDGVSETNGCTG